MLIQSPKNPRVKTLMQYQKSSNRKSLGVFTLEGLREINRAHEHGIEFQEIWWCESLYDKSNESLNFNPYEDTKAMVYTCNEEVFQKIAYRGESGGVVVLASVPKTDPEWIQVEENDLFIVLETVEKPGNLGAILRTADGAGVKALFYCDGQTDLYNPNVIRASLGAVFSIPVVECTSEEALA
jgi:TrmH family RNA methyltransferase